jgi:hypothetical protein
MNRADITTTAVNARRNDRYRSLAILGGVIAVLATLWVPKIAAANRAPTDHTPVHHTHTLRLVIDGDATSSTAAYTDATGTHQNAPTGVDITVTDLVAASIAVFVQDGGCEILLDGITEAAFGSDTGADPGQVDLCLYPS